MQRLLAIELLRLLALSTGWQGTRCCLTTTCVLAVHARERFKQERTSLPRVDVFSANTIIYTGELRKLSEQIFKTQRRLHAYYYDNNHYDLKLLYSVICHEQNRRDLRLFITLQEHAKVLHTKRK